DVAPGAGKGPAAFGPVRAHRGALRPRRAFALAALHFLAHLRVHLLERNVADSLLCHGMSSPAAFGRSLKSGISKSASSGTGWQDRRKRDSTDLRPFVLTQLAQPAEPSLRLDAGRLDHARVFPDFASHEYLEF